MKFTNILKTLGFFCLFINGAHAESRMKDMATRMRDTPTIMKDMPATMKDIPNTKPVESKPLDLIYDGKALMGPGTLDEGCYYDNGKVDKEKIGSLSDHAPVIYGNMAIWNIGSPISHYKINIGDDNEPRIFFNHKFHTDPDGNLIGRDGNKVGMLGNSEVFLLKANKNGKTRGYAAVTQNYVTRLENIAQAIKKIFADNSQVDYLLLQEVPGFRTKTIAGEKIHNLIKEFFRPANKDDKQELFINFFNENAEKVVTEVSKNDYKKGLIPDIAIVSRANAKVKLYQTKYADFDSRFVPFCNKGICKVAVHMPFPITKDELKTRCTDIKNLAARLMKDGFRHIEFAGDFNTSAESIVDACTDELQLPNANVEVHSSGAGSSCSTNHGDITPKSIDIMIKYTKNKES